jgi:hypothetical protein
MGFISWLFGSLYGPNAHDLNSLAQTMYDAFKYEDDRITESNNQTADAEMYANQREVNDIAMVLMTLNIMAGALRAVVVVNIANLRQYVDNRIDSLQSSLSNQLSWFMNIVNVLVWGLRLLIDGIREWVQVSIAAPLWSALNAFIRWATGEIWTLLQYILHPELLVKLLAAFIWQMWLSWLHIFAVPIARFLIRTMFTLREEFVGIILDVLSEIV